MLTESRNPRSTHIDQMTALEIVTLMNEEDALIPHAIRDVLPQIAAAVDCIVERLQTGGRLFYVGAGTSGRLGLLDAAECLPTFSAPPEMVQGIMAGGVDAMANPTEDAEDNAELARADLAERRINAGDVVVGIAASGRTPYVIAALEYARAQGAATVAVTCNLSGPLLERADYPIAAVTGPEVLTGSTRLKAGTAQKMVLNMLSTASMIRLGKVYENLMVDVQPTNAKLKGRARRIVAEALSTDENAAGALLDDANGEVKTAILMGLTGMGADDARARLSEQNGHLRNAIPGG